MLNGSGPKEIKCRFLSTLFLLKSFTTNDIEYSKSTINNPNIIPSKNVINKLDECERNQNQEIKSDTVNCK